jgi:hypothetical protein
MFGRIASKLVGNVQQDPSPLIDGLLEGVDQLTDVVIGLFGFIIVLGFLGLVYGVIRWKNR